LLKAADTMSEGDYFGVLKRRLSDSPEKKAFIFVHGYNVSFEDAALRTGQMAIDLSFQGIACFYSWPSQANPLKYTIDEANVEWAEPNLRQFFERFAKESSAEEIFVIAHSVGSRAATRALLATVSAQPSLKGRFKELVLAAPDIDAEVFKRDIVPGFAKLSQPVTLYASSDDKALLASKTVHGSPRAGDSGSLIVVVRGMETVDATNVDTSFLGHSTFVESRAVLTDMALLLGPKRLRANERPGLNEVAYAPRPYWRFRR
jgi:esterase/lipase superfamily enzyme